MSFFLLQYDYHYFVWLIKHKWLVTYDSGAMFSQVVAFRQHVSQWVVWIKSQKNALSIKTRQVFFLIHNKHCVFTMGWREDTLMGKLWTIINSTCFKQVYSISLCGPHGVVLRISPLAQKTQSANWFNAWLCFSFVLYAMVTCFYYQIKNQLSEVYPKCNKLSRHVMYSVSVDCSILLFRCCCFLYPV